MEWVKCIPIVGTGISAIECVEAIAEGDGERALWKFGETLVDGAMDASIFLTGGLAAAVTSPAKMAGKAAGKVAVTAVAARVVGGAVAHYVADGKHASSGFGGESGQDNYQEDEDPEGRKNNIRKTCNLSFRPSRVRHFTKKARSTFDEKFDINEKSLPQANERIVERMLSYVEVMHHSWSNAVMIPEQAIKRIHEALRSSNALNTFYLLNRDDMVVQVDETFSGTRADGTSWSITFTIDADVPPPGSRQTAHFGITIERDSGSYRNIGHVFVTEEIPYGRGAPYEQSSNSKNTTWAVEEARVDNGTFKYDRKITYLKKKKNAHPS